MENRPPDFGKSGYNGILLSFLNPGSPQSKLAPGLLQLVTEVLQDKAYLARLQRHYALFKQALNDPILSTFAQRYKRLRSKPRRRKHR